MRYEKKVILSFASVSIISGVLSKLIGLGAIFIALVGLAFLIDRHSNRCRACLSWRTMVETENVLVSGNGPEGEIKKVTVRSCFRCKQKNTS